MFGISCINSSPPSAAYKRHSAGSSSVKVMACHLFVAKPLADPMLLFWTQLDSWEQTSVTFEPEFCHFHPIICIVTRRLLKRRSLWLMGDELTFTNEYIHARFGDIQTPYAAYDLSASNIPDGQNRPATTSLWHAGYQLTIFND